MGKTLVINYDMQLPRPYSNRWMLQGTLGVYDEEKSSIYLRKKVRSIMNGNHGSPMRRSITISGGRQISLLSRMEVLTMLC